jgi:hypothetical protein
VAWSSPVTAPPGAQWIGIACIPAAVGALVALVRRHERAQAALVTVLAVSGALAPLNQARIHTTTSLSKHVDFGAWFAAAAAGYLIARLARISRHRWAGAAVALAASAAVLIPAAAVGRVQSGTTISVIRSFTHDPVLITETGVAPAAGKAATMPRLFAAARSAGVLGVVYFDAKGYRDWRIDGDATALAAFRKAAQGFG